MDNYSYSNKVYLYNILNQITDQKQMHDILNIISCNDKKNIIENDKGVYIKLSNLNNETYNKLEKYIENIKK